MRARPRQQGEPKRLHDEQRERRERPGCAGDKAKRPHGSARPSGVNTWLTASTVPERPGQRAYARAAASGYSTDDVAPTGTISSADATRFGANSHATYDTAQPSDASSSSCTRAHAAGVAAVATVHDAAPARDEPAPRIAVREQEHDRLDGKADDARHDEQHDRRRGVTQLEATCDVGRARTGHTRHELVEQRDGVEQRGDESDALGELRRHAAILSRAYCSSTINKPRRVSAT